MTDTTSLALTAWLQEHPARPYMNRDDWFSPTAPRASHDDSDADGRMADWESARVYGA